MIRRFIGSVVLAALLIAGCGSGGGGGGGSSSPSTQSGGGGGGGGGGSGGGGTPLAVTTSSLPGGTVGVAYSATLTASGGAPPDSWSLGGGALPPGLSLASSGSISGTPGTSGTYGFTVKVTDSASTPGSATKALSITIAPGSGGGGGGSTPGWSTVPVGTTQDLYGVDFAGASGWIVGTTQTILHTTDSGGTWGPQTGGFFTSTQFTSETDAHALSPWPAWGTYHLIGIHAVSASVIWVSSVGPLSAPGASVTPDNLSCVFVSADGGATWKRVVMATNFQLWGIYGFSATSAFVASIGSPSHTDSDIFTISGGVDVSRTPMTFDALYDLTFVSASTGFSAGNAIFKTTDGGANWNATSAPGGQYRCIRFVDGSNGWAVGDGGLIVHTSNGGATWTTQTSGTTQALWGVSFADASNGWAVGHGGTVLRTTNGGSTWTAESSGTTQNLNDVRALSATVAWAVGNGGTVLKRD